MPYSRRRSEENICQEISCVHFGYGRPSKSLYNPFRAPLIVETNVMLSRSRADATHKSALERGTTKQTINATNMHTHTYTGT